jgi:hypothetical protein
MRKSLTHLTALAAAALLLVVPMTSLATQVQIPEFALTLSFPAFLDVFTRNMPENDPVLALYGKSTREVSRELADAGLYAKAKDIAGDYILTLTVKSRNGQGYGQMDEEALRKAARQSGGSRFEVFTSPQGAFLLVYDDSLSKLVCFFQGDGLLYEMRLETENTVNDSMVTTLKALATGADFGLGQ